MILTEFSDGKTIFKIFTNYKVKQLNLALEPSNIKLIPIPNKKRIFYYKFILMKQEILKFDFKFNSNDFL